MHMNISSEKRLFITLLVAALILLGELIGGYLSNSLALISDAGHMITDVMAIGLGLVADRISRKSANKKATFGYVRVGLLAALINGVSLLLIALYIFYESYHRIMSPPKIELTVMLSVASLGLTGNLIMAFILGHKVYEHEDLNRKGVWLHVIGDTLSSVGVILSGIVIYFTGWAYADPVASVLIGAIIIWSGVRLVRETVSIFLDLTPKGLDVDVIAKKIFEVPEVVNVHDVHLWPVAYNNIAFTAHILVNDQTLAEVEETKKKIQVLLKEYGIDHSTLQIECSSKTCDTNLYCQGNGRARNHSQNL